MTAPRDPLEEAARTLETLLDLNGHTRDGVLRAARAAIQAYLRARAEGPAMDATDRDTLRMMIYELDPAPAETAICLVCGAKEPCMTEADLDPSVPGGVPCTFDPPIAPAEPTDPSVETAEGRAELREWLRTWKAPDNTAASVAEIAVDALNALDFCMAGGAHVRAQFAEARAAERERCARVADRRLGVHSGVARQIRALRDPK